VAEVPSGRPGDKGDGIGWEIPFTRTVGQELYMYSNLKLTARTTVPLSWGGGGTSETNTKNAVK
jgi:hypothetical protein